MKTLYLLSVTLIALVAGLHIVFLVLEMFLWQQPLGLKIFSQTSEEAAISAALAKNQGLYNGFLAAGLIWGALTNKFDIKIFFLVCVVIAGIYGAATVGVKILFIQAIPALLALFVTLWLQVYSITTRV